MTNFTVTIDRLILTDLDLTPTEAEALRGQLASSLQQALSRREFSSEWQPVQVDRLRLANIQTGRNGQVPANDIAQRLVQALPGRNQKGSEV